MIVSSSLGGHQEVLNRCCLFWSKLGCQFCYIFLTFTQSFSIGHHHMDVIVLVVLLVVVVILIQSLLGAQMGKLHFWRSLICSSSSFHSKCGLAKQHLLCVWGYYTHSVWQKGCGSYPSEGTSWRLVSSCQIGATYWHQVAQHLSYSQQVPGISQVYIILPSACYLQCFWPSMQ